MILPRSGPRLSSWRPFRTPGLSPVGWAIDLFVNQVTRPHSDVEIGLFREHQSALRTQLAGWRLTKSDFLRPEGAAWLAMALKAAYGQHVWIERLRT